MAAVTGTPVTGRAATPLPPPTVWESADCQKACAVMTRLGVGADMRLCCRPWAPDRRVADGVMAFRIESAVDAFYAVLATLISWFWNGNVLVVLAIVSAIGLVRNIGYCLQARAGLGGGNGMSQSALVVWAASILLHLSALGCVSFDLDVLFNLESLTLEEARLFEPLFWVGTVSAVLGPLASVSVATEVIGFMQSYILASPGPAEVGDGETDERALARV